MDNDKLIVVREKFTASNGNEYYAYVLNGVVKSRKIKVDFIPKDKGGYEVLDLLFIDNDNAELVIIDKFIDNTLYTEYILRTTDINGQIFECGVKPAKDSDKWLLRMILNQSKNEREGGN